MTVSRRRLLQAGGAVGGALLVSSCSSGGFSSGPKPAGPPRPGGTLRVGALGNASSTTREPHTELVNDSDYLITSLLYDTLTVPAASPVVAPRLASRWVPSPDLRTWRFELAPGVRFHDGTPMTAGDVAYSIRRLLRSPTGSSRLPGIQPDGVRAEGAGTVVVESDYPDSEVPVLTRLCTFVIKDGTDDPAGAPGTGPFKLDWFQDGNARLVRNEDWFAGPPYLDAIEVYRFDRVESMANALLSQEIDLASNVGNVAARAAEHRDGVQIVRRPDDMALPVVMRTSDGPYADPRVREAFRLAVDRDAMVRRALSGYGSVANDVMGTADPLYARDIPQRTQDLGRARQLLDEAGFDRSRTYPLVTTEDVPGLAESATLFARQLQDVGVQLQVVKQESGTFLGRSKGRAPLYTTYRGTNDSIVQVAGRMMLSGSGANEAAWHDPEFDEAYRQAISATTPEQHRKQLRRMQQIEHDRSGYLLWGMADGVDVAKDTVQDLPTLPGYGRVQLERTWLSS